MPVGSRPTRDSSKPAPKHVHDARFPLRKAVSVCVHVGVCAVWVGVGGCVLLS